MTHLQHLQATCESRPEIDGRVVMKLEKYLHAVMSSFQITPHGDANGEGDLADRIFRILTSRRYSHLSRGRSAKYRDRVLPWIVQAVRANQPVRFYYDLGGGYRASLRPREERLTFTVGLGELLALRQIALFCKELRAGYPPGALFWVVIDNLCAHFTNDIPISLTTDYANQLRRLISQVRLSDCVQVLVESELFSVAEFRSEFSRATAQSTASCVSSEEHENVARFLGRLCEPQEAEERVERYRRASAATERLLSSVVQGIRLTQRASPDTLCFRSFHGGDQRIQSGDVALSHDTDGNLKPVLITTRNVDHYRRVHVRVSGYLPPLIPEVVLAEPLSSTAV